MPIWPIQFPDPVFREIKEGAPLGAVVEKAVDIGPPKRRRRSTSILVPFELVFLPMTEVFLDDFRTFYDETLGFGVLSFDMPHPITEVVKTWRFVSDDPYNIQPIGIDAHKLTATLEQLP